MRVVSRTALLAALAGVVAIAQTTVDGFWKGVTMSSDGLRIAVVGDVYDFGTQEYYGSLFYSADGAGTLTYSSSLGPRNFSGTPHPIAAARDGGTLLVSTDNGLFRSVDGGATWAPAIGNGTWLSVAVSADASTCYALQAPSSLFKSSDSGITWVVVSSAFGWSDVATSANGTVVLAANGGVQLSLDGAATITTPPGAPTSSIATVAVSASATVLAVMAETGAGNNVWVSLDVGMTWVACSAPVAGGFIFRGVFAADGSRLALSVGNANIVLTSVDNGATWTTYATPSYFDPIAASDDALTLVAGSGGGAFIYISTDGGATWSPAGNVLSRTSTPAPSISTSPTWSATASITPTPAGTPGHSNGAACSQPSDCASGACTLGVCTPPLPSVARA